MLTKQDPLSGLLGEMSPDERILEMQVLLRGAVVCSQTLTLVFVNTDKPASQRSS